MPDLSYLLLTPFVGALAITFLPRDASWAIRATALFASAMTFALSWVYIGDFDYDQAGLQFFHQTEWNTRLGTSFALGLDGFSYPMVLLATLLSLVARESRATIFWYFCWNRRCSVSSWRRTGRCFTYFGS
ncbi:MAG: hypothetical protein ABW141_08955 [Candidatus Thiodiazotropha endolucinida]